MLALSCHWKEIEVAVTLLSWLLVGVGGRVGVAPRVFLKKLVADVLDRVDQFADFDPRKHYALTVSAGELSEEERNAAGLIVSASRPDDIELDLPSP